MDDVTETGRVWDRLMDDEAKQEAQEMRQIERAKHQRAHCPRTKGLPNRTHRCEFTDAGVPLGTCTGGAK